MGSLDVFPLEAGRSPEHFMYKQLTSCFEGDDAYVMQF